MTALGYLVPEFPGQTHAFFWREVTALRDGGLRVELLSTRRPAPGSCPHPFADQAEAQTAYLFPPGAAALAGLAARPRGLARALTYAAGVSGAARVAALIPSAMRLVQHCAARGIGHVHVHSCANAAHLAALAQMLGGPGYSVTVHGDLAVYGADHDRKFARARLVTAVTEPLAQQVRAVWPGHAVPVIPMGVDVDRFRPADGARAEGPARFVTVARLQANKGHVHILRALARLRDAGVEARYTIVGSGPDAGAIAAEIAALGLGDRVEMAGTLGQDAVLALLQQADALVLASVGLGEAAPVAVMEAMACGLPVICSRIGGTADMMTDGVEGFLTPQGDENAITAAAGALATDPALRARMGAAARARACAAFDYRVQAGRLRAALADAGAV